MEKILNYRCLPKETRNGDMNFIGATIAFFEENTKDCNEVTCGRYIDDYNEVIFPLVDVEIPIADYTDQTLEDLHTRLQTEKGYKDTTMLSRYQHLLRDPYKAYRQWLAPEWCKISEKLKENVAAAGEILLKIPRSLTVQQELVAERILLSDPKTSIGENVGLAEMLLAALRNSEACGLDFGDMVELKEYPGYYYFRMYETTVGSRNKTKIGGKTRNAPRRIPIPRVLSDFIKKREEFVFSQITFPCKDSRGRVFNSIKEVPIACKGTNYIERCGADDLTRIGKKLLCEDLRFSAEDLTALEMAVEVLSKESMYIKEKDPTTYLFRRNAATHLFHCGFSSLQIYAYMGHDLHDELIERSDFADEEYLYEMSKLLDNHPLNPKQEKELIDMRLEESVVRKNVTRVEFSLPAGRTFQVFIRNRESGDATNMIIQGGSGAAKITTSNALEPPESEISVAKALQRLYEQERKKLEK